MCARWHRGYAYQPLAPMCQLAEAEAVSSRLNDIATKA